MYFSFREVSESGFCKIYDFNSVIKIVGITNIQQSIAAKLFHS